MVDPQLRHACPYRPDITRIAANEALNPGLNLRLGPQITKTPKPSSELLCTADFKHLNSVAPWLRPCKGPERHPRNEVAILRTLKISGG